MKKNKKKLIVLLTIIGFLFVIGGSAFGVFNNKFSKKEIKVPNIEKQISTGISELPNDKLYTRNGNNELSANGSTSFNLNDNSYNLYGNVRNRPSTITMTRNNRYWIGWRLTKCPTGALYIVTCDSDLESNKNMGPMTASVGGTTLSRANDGDSNYTRGNNATIYVNNASVGNSINVKTQGADELKIFGAGTGTVNFLSRNDEHDITLTIVEPYYVGYDKNYGDSGVEGRIISYKGATYKTRTNWFSRTGYTFVRWNKSSNGGGTNVDAGSNYTIPASNTVLYAQWRKNNYTISFNTNGANQSLSNISTSYDTNVTIPSTTLTKDGYTFKGYSTSQSGPATYQPGQVVSNLTSSDGATVTLYAIWEEAPTTTYTVTFDANGGTGTMNSSTFVHQKNSSLPSNAFTRRGYEFDGWNTKADGTGTSYVTGGTINQGISVDALTLYAQWKIKEYPLTFDLNGGTADGTLPTKYTVETGDITLPDVTKRGYTFLGWTGTDVSTPTKGLVIPSGSIDNRSYVAVFEVKQFSTDLTKGTGISSVTGGGTYNYGDEVTLRATLEEGYDFDGWYDEDGNKVSDDINYTFTMSDEPLNLTARGKVSVYDVTYNDEDGTNKKLELEYNTKVTTVVDGERTEYVIKQDTVIPDPTKTGYHFTGWTDTKKGDDHILISNFDINHYTINVNVENGRTDGQSTYDVVHGDDQIIRVIPNDGYAFDTILIDGEPVVMTNNEYEFTNITGGHNVVVKFAEDSDGNGIPDKYEVNVTYKIVNGTWEQTGTDEDLVIPYALYEYKNGVWTRIGKVVLDTLPEVIPNENYKLGDWSAEIDEETEVDSNITYTYTCVREYKFIKQPTINDEKSDNNNYVVDWKTNFEPTKMEIIDPTTGEVIEVLEDPTVEEIEKKLDELQDENIVIRSYYDDDNYVDSEEITLKYIEPSKNPTTSDNTLIYIGAASASLLGLLIVGIYIRKNKEKN